MSCIPLNVVETGQCFKADAAQAHRLFTADMQVPPLPGGTHKPDPTLVHALRDTIGTACHATPRQARRGAVRCVHGLRRLCFQNKFNFKTRDLMCVPLLGNGGKRIGAVEVGRLAEMRFCA